MSGPASASVDRIFTASDAALPGRDTLLDDRRMRDVFARCLGVEGPLAVGRVEQVRAKYRPGESLRVLHRVEAAGRTVLVSSRVRPHGADALYEDAVARAVPCGPVRGVALERDLGAVFWTFPNDRRLPPIGDGLGTDPLLARRAGAPSPRVTVAGYAPERAVVFRVADEWSDRAWAFVKQLSPDAARAAAGHLDRLATLIDRHEASIVIPRVLDGDQRRGLVVIEALAGRHLHALRANEWHQAFLRLGDALGRLHALPSSEAAEGADPLSEAALAEALQTIAGARPDAASRAREVADRLRARRPAASRPVWVHGDLNSRNWLVQDRHVALFDFDQSAPGPAGADIGGVLAWMRVRTVLGQWSPAQEVLLVRAFLAGYGRCHAVPERDDLHWFRAAALVVQRAARAVSRVRVPHLAALPQLLAEADHELNQMEAARG